MFRNIASTFRSISPHPHLSKTVSYEELCEELVSPSDRVVRSDK